jgi:uncharacterized membrane protein
MAFCANCGSKLTEGSGFCGSCGTSVGVSSQPQVFQQTGSTGAAAAPAAALSPSVAGSGLAPNVAGALAYILGFITGILFFVLEPYRNDPFIRFHAMQSILFSVAAIVFSIAWGIIWGILISISGYMVFIDLPLRLLISLGLFVLWLFVMYQAYNRREYRIPFIGAFAAKQAGV